jgi:hypothetical protein
MTELADSRSFSPAAYAELIGALRERGYETKDFMSADPTKRHLIVRHDIDFSLGAALQMAEHEKKLGFASTYFVLMRTEFYNALSDEGLKALRAIAALGHTIGLHFDTALYAGDSNVEVCAAQECGWLESALERAVPVVSFHRPAPERIGSTERFAGRMNAYAPRFIRDMVYCSDSRGAWHHGEPLEHPAVRTGRALQLLIHPFWWTEPPLPPQERLRAFLEQRAQFLDQELARHCTVHRAAM